LETDCECQKGQAVKKAGYDKEELNTLPKAAVTNSFGCGNPLAFSGVKPGDVVLDLGSGAGIDLLIAAKMVGDRGRAIGVDMTDQMLDKAKEVIKESGLTNVEVRKGLIEDLPVDSESVDWVISNCVINLSPEKNKVFFEMARVLKPGGRILVSDIVAENLPESARKDLDLYCSCISGALSEREYEKGVVSAGFVDFKVTERIEYDTDLIHKIIEKDMETRSCCSSDPEVINELSQTCGPKVWSAKIFARKPMKP